MWYTAAADDLQESPETEDEMVIAYDGLKRARSCMPIVLVYLGALEPNQM